MFVFLDSMVTQMVNLHVWAFQFVRIIVHLELWSARHFQLAFSQPDFQGNCSMLASFEYCKARCDVSLLVSCLHSLVFCNTRIICAFEGELPGAFARLAKLAPLPQKLIVILFRLLSQGGSIRNNIFHFV